MPRKNCTPIAWDNFISGMDLFHSATRLPAGRFRDGENFRVDTGDLVSRPGSSKWNDSEWNEGDTVDGLFRYYYGGNKRFLIATGADIRVGTPASSNSVAAGLGLGLTGMTQATFAQFRDKAYIAHDSSAKGIIRYDGTDAVALSDTVLTAPATAPTITPQTTTLLNLDSATGWSTSDESDFAVSLDTDYKVEGTGCLKVDGTGGFASYNEYITYDWGEGNEQDWSGIDKINLYVRLTIDGEEAGKAGVFGLRFSETGADLGWKGSESFSIAPDGEWQLFTWDISWIPDADKNSIRYFRFFYKSFKTGAFDLYIDHIHASGTVGEGDDRKYVFCYYNSTTDKESLLSPVSDVVQNLGEQLENLASGSRSSQTDIDYVRIYRTRAGEDLTSPTWYLVEQIDNPASGDWSYTDRKSDNELGAVYSEYGASGVQAPFTCTMLLLHEDRMFYSGNSTDPSRVLISNWQDPETCPTITFPSDSDEFTDETGGMFDVARQDGQAITCLVEHGPYVLALKEASAYIFSGSSFNPFSGDLFNYKLLSGVAGCVGPWAAAFCENETCWVDKNTVWAWRPGSLTEIGREVRDVISAIPSAYQQYVSCAYRDRKLIIAYTSSSGTYNDKWLEYDFNDGSWTRHSGQNRGPMVVATNPGDNVELYFGDRNAAYIWQGETGLTDGGTAITCKWLSPVWRAPKAGTARFRYLDIEADGLSGSTNATLSIYRDQSAALGDTADATATYGMFGTGIQLVDGSLADSNYAKTFQIAFEAEVSEELRVRSVRGYVDDVRQP